jgi:RNA polymerase sigma factor (sigma-70 family)
VNTKLDSDHPSDADLIERCRAGQSWAWEALVRRYQRLVYTVPRRAGLDEAQVADVFQTCFSRLFEGLARIEDGSRVQAWLVTTARRETLRLLGLRQRETSLDADVSDAADGEEADVRGNSSPLDRLVDSDPLPEDRLALWQEQDRLRRVLDQLDAPTRRLVDLLFLQDPPLAYAELSRQLEIPVGSIGPTRARCLAKLRRALEMDLNLASGPVSDARPPPLSAGRRSTGTPS